MNRKIKLYSSKSNDMKSEAKKAEYKVIHSWIKTEPKEKIWKLESYLCTAGAADRSGRKRNDFTTTAHMSAHFPTA